jgi:hypothetical protein
MFLKSMLMASFALGLASCAGGPEFNETPLPDGSKQVAVTTQSQMMGAPVITTVYQQQKDGVVRPIGMAGGQDPKMVVLGAGASALGSYAGVGLATHAGSLMINNTNTAIGGGGKVVIQQ